MSCTGATTREKRPDRGVLNVGQAARWGNGVEVMLLKTVKELYRRRKVLYLIN